MLEKTKSLLKAVSGSLYKKFILLILNDVLKHLGLKNGTCFYWKVARIRSFRRDCYSPVDIDSFEYMFLKFS